MLALEGVEPFGYEVATRPISSGSSGCDMARTDLEPAQPVRRRRGGRGAGCPRLGRTLLRAVRRARRRPRPRARRLLGFFDECIASYEGTVILRDPMRALPRLFQRDAAATLSSDEQLLLARLADRDGVFGLMLHPLTIDPVEPDRSPVSSTTLDHAASGDRARSASVSAADLDEAGCTSWTARTSAAGYGLMPPLGSHEGNDDRRALRGREQYPALVRRPGRGGAAGEGEQLDGLLAAKPASLPAGVAPCG